MSFISKDTTKKANAGSSGDPKRANNGGATADASTKSAKSSKPTQAQVQEGLAKSQRALFALGEIVSILMKSRQHRGASLTDVESMVMPAISSGQFLVARARSNTTGLTAPVAVALWANVSEIVDRRLSEKLDGPSELKPEEWTSGEIPWLITFLGDPRAINSMLEALQQDVLKGRPLKVRTKGKDGKTTVQAFPPTLSLPK